MEHSAREAEEHRREEERLRECFSPATNDEEEQRQIALLARLSEEEAVVEVERARC